MTQGFVVETVAVGVGRGGMGCTVQGLHKVCQRLVEDAILSCVGETGDRWRIKEFAARVGVQEQTLRAWERRYQLLQPERSGGGFRLYSPADERRMHSMRAHMARGMGAAQAAALAVAESARDIVVPARPDELIEALVAAAEAFDVTRFDTLLDAAFARGRRRDRRRGPAHARGGRRALGAQRAQRGPGALRQPPRRAPPAGHGDGWETGAGPAGAARLRARRAPHARARVLRPAARRARLADRLPRRRHAGRAGRRHQRVDPPRHRRALLAATAVSARRMPPRSGSSGAGTTRCSAAAGVTAAGRAARRPARRRRTAGDGPGARRAPAAPAGARHRAVTPAQARSSSPSPCGSVTDCTATAPATTGRPPSSASR